MIDIKWAPSTQPPQRSAIATQTEIPTMGKMIDSFETPKGRISSSVGDEELTDNDYDYVLGFYEIASP